MTILQRDYLALSTYFERRARTARAECDRERWTAAAQRYRALCRNDEIHAPREDASHISGQDRTVQFSAKHIATAK